MSRSSIFSFETLTLRSAPAGWLVSIVLALTLVATAEIAARFVVAPIGERVWAYWDPQAAAKFEWYRQLAAEGDAPQVLLIGDSTGARNFDPRSFAAAGGVGSVYNMAWPANFPRALQVNTLPLLETGQAPETVIVMLMPLAFADLENVERFEAGVLSGVLGKRHRGEFVAADLFHLARLYPGRSHLARHWFHSAPLVAAPNRNGFMPFQREGTDAGPIPGVDRSVPRFTDARRSVVEKLVQIAARRGFHLIVVVGPSPDPTPSPASILHMRWLRELLQHNPDGFRIWDLRALSLLEPSDFRDEYHLWESGAEKLSSWMGERYRREALSELTDPVERR